MTALTTPTLIKIAAVSVGLLGSVVAGVVGADNYIDARVVRALNTSVIAISEHNTALDDLTGATIRLTVITEGLVDRIERLEDRFDEHH